MADKRVNNGGARDGAGRKTKAEDKKVQRMLKSQMIKVFGSEEKFIKHGLDKAQTNFNYYKLMMEYRHGKPTEHKEIDGQIHHIDWGDE